MKREREREKGPITCMKHEIRERDMTEGGLSNNIVLLVCWCGT